MGKLIAALVFMGLLAGCHTVRDTRVSAELGGGKTSAAPPPQYEAVEAPPVMAAPPEGSLPTVIGGGGGGGDFSVPCDAVKALLTIAECRSFGEQAKKPVPKPALTAIPQEKLAVAVSVTVARRAGWAMPPFVDGDPAHPVTRPFGWTVGIAAIGGEIGSRLLAVDQEYAGWVFTWAVTALRAGDLTLQATVGYFGYSREGRRVPLGHATSEPVSVVIATPPAPVPAPPEPPAKPADAPVKTGGLGFFDNMMTSLGIKSLIATLAALLAGAVTIVKSWDWLAERFGFRKAAATPAPASSAGS
jgi:hypothetical protein